MSSLPTDLVGQLSLKEVNANVHSVHLADGSHVGNLKRIGGVWKFKAVGYDAAGGVEPGGGPLTDWHNTVLQSPPPGDIRKAAKRFTLNSNAQAQFFPADFSHARNSRVPDQAV